jgi:hypothetical protein
MTTGEELALVAEPLAFELPTLNVGTRPVVWGVPGAVAAARVDPPHPVIEELAPAPAIVFRIETIDPLPDTHAASALAP